MSCRAVTDNPFHFRTRKKKVKKRVSETKNIQHLRKTISSHTQGLKLNTNVLCYHLLFLSTFWVNVFHSLLFLAITEFNKPHINSSKQQMFLFIFVSHLYKSLIPQRYVVYTNLRNFYSVRKYSKFEVDLLVYSHHKFNKANITESKECR